MRTLRPRLALLLLLACSAVPRQAFPARFEAHGGIGFVAMTSSSVEGALLTLEDRRGREVGRGTTDRFGSLIFRELAPGRGYLVRDVETGETIPVTVLDFQDHPDQSFYQGKPLHDGYNYIQTRDGTLLAANVHAPLGKTLADGPFPTVIEYSGYT